MSKINYHMESNYLAFYDGVVDRFNSNGDLAIYGSKEDVNDYRTNLTIKKVSECSVELQEEYKKLVDKNL